MCCCLIYPFIYDMTQLSRQGLKNYFSDKWNHIDQMHIWFGFLNIILQVYTSIFKSQNHEINHITQLVQIAVTFFMLIKTFFFLRIFSNLTYIVTMIRQVFYDLRVFLLFYFIIILQFSAVLSIIKLGNFEK